jgi:hypothetical protein
LLCDVLSKPPFASPADGQGLVVDGCAEQTSCYRCGVSLQLQQGQFHLLLNRKTALCSHVLLVRKHTIVWVTLHGLRLICSWCQGWCSFRVCVSVIQLGLSLVSCALQQECSCFKPSQNAHPTLMASREVSEHYSHQHHPGSSCDHLALVVGLSPLPRLCPDVKEGKCFILIVL